MSAIDTTLADAGLVDRVTVPDTPQALDALVATSEDAAPPDARAGEEPFPSDIASPDRGDLADDRPDVVVTEDVQGANCASAPELHDGEVLTGQHFGGSSSTIPACERSLPVTGRALWYRVTIPPDGIMEVDVNRDRRDRLDPIFLVAYSSCDPSTCLARSWGGLPVGPLLHHNESGAPRTVFVALIFYGERTSNPAVDVLLRLRPRAANGTCSTATPLTDSVTLRGQDLGASVDPMRSCLDGIDLHHPALYYSLTIPPRSSVVAGAERETPGTTPVFVSVRPPCASPGCLPTAFSVPGGAPRAQYINPTALPRPVIVTVAASADGPPPVVAVTATFRPLPVESMCSAATTLVADATIRIEHPEDATEPAPLCASASGGQSRALYYDIAIPPGQTLTVTAATSLFPPDAFVRLLSGCAGACVAASPSGILRAVASNPDRAPVRVVVATGLYRPEVSAPIDLRSTLRPMASNLSCAGALPLTPGTPIRNVELLEAREPSPCNVGGGPALFYRVDVTPGATLE